MIEDQTLLTVTSQTVKLYNLEHGGMPLVRWALERGVV